MKNSGVTSPSKRYSAAKLRIFLADIAVSALFLLVFQVFFSFTLSGVVFGVFKNFYAACFVYMSVFFAAFYVAGFPLRLLNSFFLEHRFGLSNQSLSAWLGDEAKSAVLSYAVAMLGAESFYLVKRSFPGTWWAVLAFLWVFFSVVLARIMPVVIIPFFFKYLPVDEKSSFRERILVLSKKCAVPVLDVCRIDLSRKTRKANAALVGLGGTRRVILADTLTDEFTDKEVETVVAHEFGHHKYGHMLKLVAFSALVTLSGFFLLSLLARNISAFGASGGIYDVSNFPVLAFILMSFGMIMLPLENLFSRRLEREADMFALKATGDAGTFVSVMKKLAAMNLSDTDPSLFMKIFFYSHPPISERIRMGERYDGI